MKWMSLCNDTEMDQDGRVKRVEMAQVSITILKLSQPSQSYLCQHKPMCLIVGSKEEMFKGIAADTAA